ncbi:M23 family metallopeptidase [Hymenobacter arizonensis]|uniref:Peptidase family M23 n=1 Tax=Hymenobacter arizonensis TaxID=1227077 RepID=A0A1I6BRG9_HYMAR|nr:M23 family metallopeptidase [Hymenobacter arizonensis]SFQ83513.1 Peptidase family M23 [Hymenobacter arizonensis]
MKTARLLIAFLLIGWCSGRTTAQGAPAQGPGAWVCEPCGKACDADPYAAPGACTHCGMALVPRAARDSLRAQASARQPGAAEPSLWPVQLEMRVPFEPTAFPSGANAHLLYELYLTNFGPVPLVARRLEVLDANARGAQPLATFQQAPLAAMLPSSGVFTPATPQQRLTLAPGQSVIVFMAVAVDRNARMPKQLVHRLHTDGAAVEGALIGTHHTVLPVLGPPVDGPNWLAADGPSNDADNHHRRGVLVLGGQAVDSRRYAIDWKQLRDGASFAGDAREVRAYHCYGKAVLAVADGRVVTARDGLPDNLPGHGGSFRPAVPITLETVAGNFLVLDLGGGHFAHYLHLQPGSVRVKAGERVRRGQVLAAIGGSGDAREPHLHFEVTTSPRLLRGEGVPYLIDRYRCQTARNGATEPRRRELPLDDHIVVFGKEPKNRQMRHGKTTGMPFQTGAF